MEASPGGKKGCGECAYACAMSVFRLTGVDWVEMLKRFKIMVDYVSVPLCGDVLPLNGN
jgi:hypothetical protein